MSVAATSSSSSQKQTQHPSPEQLRSLTTTANAFCAAHGIQVERHNDATASSYYQTAPISLLPNAYPAPAFSQAQTLAEPLNHLVDRISRDATFLQDTLGGSVAQADPFTATLLELYQSIYVNEATASTAARSADRLGIHRSDYMLHQKTATGVADDKDDAYSIQQVELNTIAASFGGLSCQVAQLHTYLLQQAIPQTDGWMDAWFASQRAKVGGTETTPSGVPTNPTLERLPEAMHVAVQRYTERFVDKKNHQGKNVVILFVVQEGETNTVDQRLLEFRLFTQYQIPVVRLSLRAIHEQVTVTDSGAALLDDGREVAVVYFRAGYAPTDYSTTTHEDSTTPVEWLARERLERSRATKCPSLGYHLAGTKKIQQQLARPGVVERFFPNDDATAQLVRSSFAGLYSLGEDATPEEDLQAVRRILDEEQQGNYVLKPQREGGGYNFYGDQLLEKLQQNVTRTDTNTLVLDTSLGEYILMERLFPPEQDAVLMRDGRIEGTGASVSELGCFGTIVATEDGAVVHNSYAGFLLRTKFSNVDEGGVASGFATLSSPYLC